MSTPILIPAYRPGPQLIAVVQELIEKGVNQIVIVDNASGPDFAPIFAHCTAFPQVRILRHQRNLGKGASLKAGMRYILQAFPGCSGVVTADADGQHHPDDIFRIAQLLADHPDCLVLGSRDFEGQVPLRSRFGNACTRVLVRLILGQPIRDSQCGLRGLPLKLMPYLLDLPSNAYEFELDVLIAAKHLGLPLIEQPIRTIYEPGNPTSHFDPIRDSMKIYFVLFRFSLLSLLTAALDNLVFYVAFHAIGNLLAAQVISRSAAVLFNYSAARRAVFLSHEPNKILLPRYLSVVLASGAASYQLIRFLGYSFGLPVIPAKVIAESLLFALNFIVLRDFVFTGRSHEKVTDWTRYYQSESWAARFSRKYTARALVGAFRKLPQDTAGGIVVELGGASSCFLDRIVAEVQPRAYHIIDNNDYGLRALSVRPDKPPQVRLHCGDVLNMDLDLRADAVFSVGLIEHFDRAGTRTAVLNHLNLLRPGGYAIVSFPTPTLVYRAARALAEFGGLWRFPDERPIRRQEVLDLIAPIGDVMGERTLWPLLYTQHLMVIRKREAPAYAAMSAASD
ncbi:MAG TPA: glycosyltransferase [Bryobacteraceae bacterium]|nr:glycosyltransferase [Bryobacteraceae bacterium]